MVFTTNYEGEGLRRIVFFFAILFLGLNLSSCVMTAGSHLKTEAAKPSEVTGTYTLLLYGCRYPDDLENVAILVREGGPYIFEIYSLATRYKIKSGLTADEALREAGQFVTCSVQYKDSRMSRISDPRGAVIGYEVRPLYSPIRFGMYDVLNIQYVLRDGQGKIVIYIKLDPTVEMQLRDEGGRDDKDGK
jgi:hypothetical protein